MSARRVKRLVIDPKLIGEMLVSGNSFKCVSGVPPTAVFLGAFHDMGPVGPVLNMAFEDESFAEVELGKMSPEFYAVIKNTQDREA